MSKTAHEYYELLATIPYVEAIEWMDDCRSVEVKLNEMKKIYGSDEHA